MNPQQNLSDIVDEMSSVLLTLQTDMIKVMNRINQLNHIITKIKQFNLNNVNNNMINNMMNINNNIQNMAMGMNNNMMGMQGMNMLMPVNGMMNNMYFGMQNINFEDSGGWALIFENKNDKSTVTIRISEQKLVKEAISMYRIKTNNMEDCKFIFNNHELHPEMKICQSGLNNLSRILVYDYKPIIGGSVQTILK